MMQLSEIDSENDADVGIIKEFKITMINMLRVLMKKKKTTLGCLDGSHG